MNTKLNTPALLLTAALTAATPAFADSGKQQLNLHGYQGKNPERYLQILREMVKQDPGLLFKIDGALENNLRSRINQLETLGKLDDAEIERLRGNVETLSENRQEWMTYSAFLDSALAYTRGALGDASEERDNLLGRVADLAKRRTALDFYHNGDKMWGVGIEFSPTSWMSVGLEGVFNLNPNERASMGNPVSETQVFPGGDSVTRTETPIYTERTADIGVVPSIDFHPFKWLSLGYSPAIVTREKTSGTYQAMATHNPSGEQIRFGDDTIPGTSDRHYDLRQGGKASLNIGRFSFGAQYIDKQGWMGGVGLRFGDTRTKANKSGGRK